VTTVSASYVSTIAADIDTSGERDVTADLQAFLDTVPDGATVDLAGGAFRCETPVKLTDRAGLTIRNGTLYRTDRDTHGGIVYPKPNPHLWLLRPTGCRVENLTVRGTNDVPDQKAGFGAYKVDYEFEAAIRMERFTDCAVTGLDADAIWGDGVQWQVGSGAYMADSRIDRIGRQGVTAICSDFLAERIRVEHGRRSGVDFEPDASTQVCHDLEVRDSYFHAIGFTFASGGRGQVNDVRLIGNSSIGTGGLLYVKASDGSRRSNWLIEDHTRTSTFGSPQPVMRFERVDGVVVRRVRAPIATTQSRMTVGLSECGGVCEISGNDFAPGGTGYYNRAPAAGQTLTVTGNTPALTQVP
jgi:hypothetical protein